MPRKKLDYKDKLHQVPIHIKGEVLETLGRSIIQETAEKSVNKEYLKAKRQTTAIAGSQKYGDISRN